MVMFILYYLYSNISTKKAIPKNTDLRMFLCLKGDGSRVSLRRKNLSPCVCIGLVAWYCTSGTVGGVGGAVGCIPGSGW